MEIINLYPAPLADDIRPNIDNQPPVCESINLYKIKDAYITSFGYIIKNFKVIKEAILIKHRNSLTFKNIFAFMFLRKTIYINSPCLSIANGWLESYYHFTIESLPKLYLLRDYINDCTLIFHSDVARFHIEWFEIIGVKNIKYINDREIIHTPLAITTSFTSETLSFHQIIIPEFVQWILQKIKNMDSINFKKVFISRKNQRHRKLLNEDKVIELLNEFDFVTLYMEDYSVSDQVKIFHNAEQIIAIHGAAITSFCFSKKKTKVLDLMHEDFNQWSYYKMSRVLEVDYEIFRCQASDKKRHPGYDDISVDISELKRKVESWNK